MLSLSCHFTLVLALIPLVFRRVLASQAALELLLVRARLKHFVLGRPLLAVLVRFYYDLNVVLSIRITLLPVTVTRFVATLRILHPPILHLANIFLLLIKLRVFVLYFLVINYILPFRPLALWWLLSLLLLFWLCWLCSFLVPFLFSSLKQLRIGNYFLALLHSGKALISLLLFLLLLLVLDFCHPLDFE